MRMLLACLSFFAILSYSLSAAALTCQPYRQNGSEVEGVAICDGKIFHLFSQEQAEFAKKAIQERDLLIQQNELQSLKIKDLAGMIENYKQWVAFLQKANDVSDARSLALVEPLQTTSIFDNATFTFFLGAVFTGVSYAVWDYVDQN